MPQPWSTSPCSTRDLQVPQAPPRQLWGRPMPAASPASRISSPGGQTKLWPVLATVTRQPSGAGSSQVPLSGSGCAALDRAVGL